MVVLNGGLCEVISLLVRKRNAGRISPTTYKHIAQDFYLEIAASAVNVIPTDNTLVLHAFPLIETHSVNGTDALVLRSAVVLQADLRARVDDWLLVASDLRLLRAAAAEGLTTFNPEIQTAADLDALLGP
jgi:hypothetical protein